MTITQEMTKVTLVGVGSQKAIVSGKKNVADRVNMYDTATLGMFDTENILQLLVLGQKTYSDLFPPKVKCTPKILLIGF